MDEEKPQSSIAFDHRQPLRGCSVFCSGPRCNIIAQEYVTDPENMHKIIGFCSEACASGWNDLWLLRVAGP